MVIVVAASLALPSCSLLGNNVFVVGVTDGVRVGGSRNIQEKKSEMMYMHHLLDDSTGSLCVQFHTISLFIVPNEYSTRTFSICLTVSWLDTLTLQDLQTMFYFLYICLWGLSEVCYN